MSKKFEKIYNKNIWGNGSGLGSSYLSNKGYVDFIEDFIKTKRIKTIVDIGCGDWQFSKYINWSDAKYKGYDVVESLIEFNKSNYSNKNINFYHYSGRFDDIDHAEMLIIKDVLQHLPQKKVLNFLDFQKNYKYVLITNCVDPECKNHNQKIKEGEFTFLDITLPPYSIKADEVYNFYQSRKWWKFGFFRSPIWQKKTFLIRNDI